VSVVVGIGLYVVVVFRHNNNTIWTRKQPPPARPMQRDVHFCNMKQHGDDDDHDDEEYPEHNAQLIHGVGNARKRRRRGRKELVLFVFYYNLGSARFGKSFVLRLNIPVYHVSFPISSFSLELLQFANRVFIVPTPHTSRKNDVSGVSKHWRVSWSTGRSNGEKNESGARHGNVPARPDTPQSGPHSAQHLNFSVGPLPNLLDEPKNLSSTMASTTLRRRGKVVCRYSSTSTYAHYLQQ
jgi:hypothetical protein